MQVDWRCEHGVECSYKVCFKAKEHVLKELNGERQEKNLGVRSARRDRMV
ncbi:hypothetical protein JG688_00009171 [Phytophthora aleatoria]|uniref:Uncharacterized protein n=1 Tax=Phytophthora aleatoria TaxID=2496075 RepID=A0A8J5IGN5_9STRA|nr:hypothetical protein JG688_00009171 [Phytophthora aleatoria]